MSIFGKLFGGDDYYKRARLIEEAKPLGLKVVTLESLVELLQQREDYRQVVDSLQALTSFLGQGVSDVEFRRRVNAYLDTLRARGTLK
jgi:hypothetical protein